MLNFFNHNIDFAISNSDKVATWILNTFDKEKILKKIELSIIFCSDESLLKINKEFLNHDYYTDIITFPIEETEDVFEAELYISIDRITDNANKLNISFQTELHRVIIHGVLHLCGYKDKSETEILEMRTKEDFYLKLLKLL